LIGRDDTISELLASLRQPVGSSHLLVSGMGGVGKTVICRKLAHVCAHLMKGSETKGEKGAKEEKRLNAVVWLDCGQGLTAALQNQLAPALALDIRDPGWLVQAFKRLN
jgi:dethiobiotin synthetase